MRCTLFRFGFSSLRPFVVIHSGPLFRCHKESNPAFRIFSGAFLPFLCAFLAFLCAFRHFHVLLCPFHVLIYIFYVLFAIFSRISPSTNKNCDHTSPLNYTVNASASNYAAMSKIVKQWLQFCNSCYAKPKINCKHSMKDTFSAKPIPFVGLYRRTTNERLQN